MRVLLVSLFHPAISPGGAQQACYNLFKGLQKAKYEPILLASVERHMWPALFKSGATITEFDKHENEFLFLSQGYDHTFHRNKDPRNLDEFEDFLRVSDRRQVAAAPERSALPRQKWWPSYLYSSRFSGNLSSRGTDGAYV